ncbi:hypothetical protein [Nocardia salmonicida]|uniref:hypothetical protein n=1 Tax=Nocardia salmonicida TaxID=53431 RepID=UPI0033DE693F
MNALEPDPTGDGRWLQSLSPIGAGSRERDRQPRVFNHSGMTPAAAARAYNRVLSGRALDSAGENLSDVQFVNDKGPTQPGVNLGWVPPTDKKPPEQPGVSAGWTPPADTEPLEQPVAPTPPQTPTTSPTAPNAVPNQENSNPPAPPGAVTTGSQPESPSHSNLSVLTELGLPLAADTSRSADPGEPIDGPFNPVLTTMWLPEGSTAEQKQTTSDGLPALQTDVSMPGLPGTTSTEHLGRSATITAALTAWTDSTSASGVGPTGYPSGTGILASGPSEQNQALLKNPVPGSAGALVTGGAAAAATTGAVLTGALAFTETGILVTAGTMAAVVTWPAVLAVVAGVGLVAGAAWVLSIDPPEGEEPSTGARPGAVPQPPPAPTLINPEIPAPIVTPVDPQIPRAPVSPETSPSPFVPPALEPPPMTVPELSESSTPWEPKQTPGLDPFDPGSDGVIDPSTVPDPTQAPSASPPLEQAVPVAPTPLRADGSTSNSDDQDAVFGDGDSADDGTDDESDWQWLIDTDATFAHERYAPVGRDIPRTDRAGDGSERYPVRDLDNEGDVVVRTSGAVSLNRAWEAYLALFYGTSVFLPAPETAAHYRKIDEYIPELFAFVDFKGFWNIEPDPTTGEVEPEFRKNFLLVKPTKEFREKVDLVGRVMGNDYIIIIVTDNSVVSLAFEEEFETEIEEGQLQVLSAEEYMTALEDVGVVHPNRNVTFVEFLESMGWA